MNNGVALYGVVSVEATSEFETEAVIACVRLFTIVTVATAATVYTRSTYLYIYIDQRTQFEQSTVP